MPKGCNQFYEDATSPISDINDLQNELRELIEVNEDGDMPYLDASKEQIAAVENALSKLIEVENILSAVDTGV